MGFTKMGLRSQALAVGRQYQTRAWGALTVPMPDDKRMSMEVHLPSGAYFEVFLLIFVSVICMLF